MPESEARTKDEDGNSDLGWDDPSYIDFITFTADNPSTFVPKEEQIEQFWDIYRQRVYESRLKKEKQEREDVKLLILRQKMFTAGGFVMA